MRKLLLFWLVACGSASDPVERSAFQPGDLAITDVSVVPMSSEGTQPHRTVVIRGDRIVAIMANAAVPPGITTIDGTGKWLMPGLVDMHVHTWRDSDFAMFLAAGVTTIRNMWGIEQHLAWRSQIERGERLGPTIFTAGPLIDGEPPDWPGSTTIVNPDDADAIVVAQKTAGYDFIKTVAQLTPKAYEAVAAAAKRHGMIVSGHVPPSVGLEGVLAAGQHSVEHLDGWIDALVPPGTKLPAADDTEARGRAALAKLDLARLPGLIQRTIAAGTWNCPTLIVYERIGALDDLAALRRRVHWLDKVPAALVATWTPPSSYTAEDFATVRAEVAMLSKILAALAAANAPILVGTDTGDSFVIPGEATHDEIELMVAAGVPRPRVMRAATADAWRYLGHPHEAGVVEVGARADLLLVASDPLTTPIALIPDGVMVRGKWLPHAQLEAMLADVAKHTAPPKDQWAGAPPLDGDVIRYDTTVGTTMTGQERFAIGTRGVVGQLVDFSNEVDTSYTLGPDAATVTASYRSMTITLAAKISAGKLVVTGKDLSGKPVSLSAPIADASLSLPGIGGAVVGKLAAMKPGSKRTFAALELDYFPAIAITPIRYNIERKPDAGGNRVFAVAATQNGSTTKQDLVVDATGLVVTQTIGTTRITRR